MNVLEPLIEHAIKYGDKVALVDDQQHCQHTYRSLLQTVQRVASGLRKYSLYQKKIAILSSNRIEFVEVLLGAIYAGYTPVPLDTKWSKKEIRTILHQIQPQIIFVDHHLQNNVADLELNIEVITFSHGQIGSYPAWLNTLNQQKTIDLQNELLFIGFTSGTTGLPKGYMRTHYSWIRSFEATKEAFKLDSIENVSASGPLIHSLSLFGLIQCLYYGGTFYLSHSFDPVRVVQQCQQLPNLILFVVPTMIEAILQNEPAEPLAIQALLCSGAKWSTASKHKCKLLFGSTPLYEFYGSSEASYISYSNIQNDPPYSVGRAFPEVDISIRDEQCCEVSIGTVGQLYVKSEMLFKGYYLLPEETANVFRQGWLVLGDYGYIDEEGYLYMTGRVHNRIISGGINLFPEEVEAVLQQMPEIAEVMILGRPHPYWGEEVVAIIQWNEESSLSLETVKEYCHSYLAHYKAPRDIITVEQFLYTSSGKIAREAMKQYIESVSR